MSSSVSIRSPRSVQQRQPVCSVDEAFLAGLDQIMVEPDLAELVDDHGRAQKLRVLEQACQQRGLAAAEESRQHRHGDHGTTSGRGAMRSRTGR